MTIDLFEHYRGYIKGAGYKEQLRVIEKIHPYHHLINKRIIEESKEFFFTRDSYNADGGISNVRALQCRDINSPSLSLIRDWILTFVDESKHGFPMFIPDQWLAIYGKGDYTVDHLHLPATYSFVYFVQSPKGSSPLVFTTSRKKIKAEDGKVVIFPSILRHHVPKNKCDDRIVFAGNIFVKYNDV